MPQMAPMSWTILFITFSIMLIMTNTMNYYLFTPNNSTKKSLKKSSTSTKYWKW